MTARIYTGAEALALLGRIGGQRYSAIRSDGAPRIVAERTDTPGGQAWVVAILTEVATGADAEALTAAPGLAASVAHHEARAERAEASAALWQRSAEAHRADALVARRSRDHWRACEERQRASTDAAVALAEAAEREMETLRGAWARIARAHRVDPSPANADRIARLCECAAEVRDEAMATREALFAQTEELTRGLAVAQSARNELRERLRQAEALAQIHREERDACAAEVLRLRAASDETLRRVRVVLDHFGVADCDDPIAALEEVPETADAVVDDEVAHANELTLQVAALRAIIEGRTTPPTDAEALAHEAADGLWLALSLEDGQPARNTLSTISPRGLASRGWRILRWWPLDAAGRPCAWPVAPEVTP